MSIAILTITPIECCACGLAFGMTETYLRQRREDGQRFFCPAGHGQSFTKSEIQRLREQIAELEQSRLYSVHAADQLTARLRNEERSHAATKGVLTRTRKRVAAGVCTDCNRTFQDLAGHMADKHKANTYAKHRQASKR